MSFILNFHGIGEAKRAYEDGEKPYWISEERFLDALDLVQASRAPVYLTFDDGNDSDFLIGVPELKRRGLPAISFVLAGKLDLPGYLSREQVAAIDADPLFSVGSHGMNHRAWPDIQDAELKAEIEGAQALLGEVCGRRITDAGLPFGRYDRKVLQALRRTGHTAIYSSDGSPRLRGANPIPRFSIRSDTDMGELARMITDQDRFLSRAKAELRSTLKALR